MDFAIQQPLVLGSGPMNSLQLLPVELIDYILSLLAKPDLLSLRLTDNRLSGLATVFVFSSIIALYTEKSLDNLKKISESKNLACHVRSFEYRFMGTYDTPMSFVQFKARLSPPGRSYYGHLLGEFYSHYTEQYEAQTRITSSRKDNQALCSAFQQLCNLKNVSLRNAEPEQYPYWQESWTYTLRNDSLGGEIAHQNITHAIRARHELHCERSLELAKIGDHPRPLTEITFFSAADLPPIFSQVPAEQTRGFEFNPLDTSLRSGLANISTLNLDLRPPRRSKYQAYQTDRPRLKYWSTEKLAHALSSLGNLEHLRLYVEASGGRGARFLENPLQGSWKSLRVVIVSGWEFTEEDVIGFVERHAQTLRSFFAGYLSLIVHKDEQADDVFFRIWGRLREMELECLLEGPFYWGVGDRGSEDDVVERTQIPISLSAHLAEGLCRKRRVLEDSLFARPRLCR